MAIDKIQSESINLADNFAFTGTVTGAGEDNKPMFRVSGNAKTVSNNTDTKNDVNTEIFDTDNCFSTGGSNRFTPNKAGKYYLNARIDANSGTNTDFYVVMFYKNGSSIGGAASINRDYNTAVASQIVEANGSSDYFEVYCKQQSGGSMSIQLAEFSGFYIGN
tara:strand:+ start:481 stop:969 length:489 start_codon:yes stop_codon:yes gene_type:complete